ncbi:MAG: NAD+ synthase [Candidatus Aenigmarchaeota archaeon]|nr:NAD+ synthase [Candidatus Aenigmarchaeota archaeon]
MDIGKAGKAIITFIRARAQQGAVVGMSGGVDSSLVAALCAEALGKDKVLGLIMPSNATSREDTGDAEDFANKLGIEHRTIAIANTLESIKSLLPGRSKIADANLAPRARMVILYHCANSLNRLVAGTGNRSELLTGYFTKYGDGGVDILPIGGLYKNEVCMLAKETGVPVKIINKAPSAGLWPGQTDEGEIGLSYNELDSILPALFDDKKTAGQAAKDTGIGLEKMKRVLYLHGKNKHKLSMPPIAEVR